MSPAPKCFVSPSLVTQNRAGATAPGHRFLGVLGVLLTLAATLVGCDGEVAVDAGPADAAREDAGTDAGFDAGPPASTADVFIAGRVQGPFPDEFPTLWWNGVRHQISSESATVDGMRLREDGRVEVLGRVQTGVSSYGPPLLWVVSADGTIEESPSGLPVEPTDIGTAEFFPLDYAYVGGAWVLTGFSRPDPARRSAHYYDGTTWHALPAPSGTDYSLGSLTGGSGGAYIPLTSRDTSTNATQAMVWVDGTSTVPLTSTGSSSVALSAAADSDGTVYVLGVDGSDFVVWSGAGSTFTRTPLLGLRSADERDAFGGGTLVVDSGRLYVGTAFDDATGYGEPTIWVGTPDGTGDTMTLPTTQCGELWGMAVADGTVFTIGTSDRATSAIARCGFESAVWVGAVLQPSLRQDSDPREILLDEVVARPGS